jgi:hypothetical protein
MSVKNGWMLFDTVFYFRTFLNSDQGKECDSASELERKIVFV